jgi:TolB-like protein
MKTGLILCWVLLLSACSSGFDPDFNLGLEGFNTGDKPPKNELNLLVGKLVEEMLSNNQFVGKQNAIAVTSMVNLQDLNTVNRFGNQISEGIIHYLHDSGFRVVDFKLTGTIQVRPDGDFIHSRDWEKLKNQQAIDYLVSGTIDQYEVGAYISVRMVGLQSQVVVGSAQAFIPREKMSNFASLPLPKKSAKDKLLMERAAKQMHLDKENEQRQIYMENGFLIRKPAVITAN